METEDKNLSLSFSPNLEGALRVLAYLVLVALIFFLASRAVRELKETKSIFSGSTITVSAEDSVFAPPDIGMVTLSVSREKKTVSEAQKEATEAANDVVAFLKSLQIEEKDIKTVSYTISPQYSFTRERGQELRGYQVLQGMEVKIRDLEKSGEILVGAAERGANQVGGLSFTIDDPEELRAQARNKAIEKAKAKAEELSDSLNVRLGKIVNFSEGGGFPPPVAFREFALGTDESVASFPGVPVGENEIIVTVSITYEIR